jgi:NO-binding membrane sensor protein with MHYT domain
MLASLAALIGIFFPWRAEVRGTAFGQSGVVAIGAAALFVSGLRIWRTRRRWVAISASALSLGLGTVGLFFAPITMLVIGGDGGGLALVFASALVAVVSGYRALGRLHADPRPWERVPYRDLRAPAR